MTEPLLSIQDLVTEFQTPDGVVHAVDHVSYDVHRGETLGVVGESGSGKSVTVMSVLGLIPSPPGRIVGGKVLFEGRDLLQMSQSQLRRIRGREIAMIFQDPMASLNPVLTVGRQLAEAITTHHRVSDHDAHQRAVEMLRIVGVPNPEARADQYPHEYSGGMSQRAMIAMAIVNQPKLLIADEPTTALDVTIQAQILDVLKTAQAETDAATILITHDLGLIAELADRVVVMYAGQAVETGTAEQLFTEPRHPYTLGLLSSLPRINVELDRLEPIKGQPPSLINMPSGCRFHPRCRLGEGRERCRDQEPAADAFAPGRLSRCHFHDEMAHEIARVEEVTGADLTGDEA